MEELKEEAFTMETAFWMNRKNKSEAFWRHALSMRRITFKKAYRIIAEHRSCTLKKAKIDKYFDSNWERMYATELAGDVHSIEDATSQAIVASMATAFSISFRTMYDMLPELTSAKTQGEVNAVLEKYVRAIERLSPNDLSKMTMLSEDVVPLEPFQEVVPNTSGLGGWSYPVHEWHERPF